MGLGLVYDPSKAAFVHMLNEMIYTLRAKTCLGSLNMGEDSEVRPKLKIVGRPVHITCDEETWRSSN